MTDTESILMVYCTCPDADSAKAIASRLVDERLAACVNVIPGLTSYYRWQGKVEADPEQLLLIKTTAQCFKALRETILEAHPAELPEVIAVPISKGHPAYLDWVAYSVRQP